MHKHPFTQLSGVINNIIFSYIKTTLKNLLPYYSISFLIQKKTTTKKNILNIKIESFYDYYTLETEPTLQEPTKKQKKKEKVYRIIALQYHK